MGRTGRKRQGRIVVILSEGREERVSTELKIKGLTILIRSSSNKLLTFVSSDVQPEPEQQAQRVQVNHRQQKRLPPVPQ